VLVDALNHALGQDLRASFGIPTSISRVVHMESSLEHETCLGWNDTIVAILTRKKALDFYILSFTEAEVINILD